jgi:beta-phosphoglucomutase-like phosphatase (HAD superfamily)
MGSPRLREVFTRIDRSLSEDVLPLVVFDLDSTLFSTAPRNLWILREFVRLHSPRHPYLSKLTAGVGVLDMGWNVHDDLKRLGVDDEELLAELKQFWRERFFSDDYLVHDTPVPGAVEFVEGVHEHGAFVYYLTGRHVGGMEVGTVRALTQRGFPFWNGRCVLHLKPSPEMNDRAFKDEALDDIRSYKGRVIATFENEPENANLFAQAFPEAIHFLLTTIHSPHAEMPSAALIQSEDFVLP